MANIVFCFRRELLYWFLAPHFLALLPVWLERIMPVSKDLAV
ncbi:hypothetical protein RJW56_00580 [Streptococcus suis]|nr:hypothetical protein [Streptococcus suis]WNF75901.1 hypothetical protein RJW56_00580 [Streptococcus suis]